MNERIEALYDRDHCIGHCGLRGVIDDMDMNALFYREAKQYRSEFSKN